MFSIRVCLALAGVLAATAQTPEEDAAAATAAAAEAQIAAASAVLADLNAAKQKKRISIRSEDGNVVIEAGVEGATLGFKVGDDTLLIDKIPEQYREFSTATANVIESGYAMGHKTGKAQASVAETCQNLLKRIDEQVDKDIDVLKANVKEISSGVATTLAAGKADIAATLKTSAEAQAKLNAELKAELLKAVKGATDDAKKAQGAADGFKACDYSKQFFNRQSDKCENVKTCKDGEKHTEKPLFADWTCAAATDCLPEKELCRANKGKTGYYTVCHDDPHQRYKVYCEMDTDKGRWTLMANINPADGNSVGFLNEDFWVHPGEYGTWKRSLDFDYKSPAAATFKGSEILGISAVYGTHKIKGWRVWGYDKTWNSMFKVGINGDQNWAECCKGVRTTPCKTTGVKRQDNGGTHGWDDIMRQGSCIYTDVNPSTSGWGDTIRLTTTNHGRSDNQMSGFASCIDCGRPWQGGKGQNGKGDGHTYMGLDRALCSSRTCAHHNIRRPKGADGSNNYWRDCRGRYCEGTYHRSWVTGWTSQFYIR